MTEERVMDKWQLDKHIPIAVILALLLQTSGIVWFASDQNARLTSLEKSTKAWQEARNNVPERLASLESTMDSIHTSLLRIERKLDKD